MPKVLKSISRYAEIEELKSSHGHYFRILDPNIKTTCVTHPCPEFFVTSDRTRFRAYRDAVVYLLKHKPNAIQVSDGISDKEKPKDFLNRPATVTPRKNLPHPGLKSVLEWYFVQYPEDQHYVEDAIDNLSERMTYIDIKNKHRQNEDMGLRSR